MINDMLLIDDIFDADLLNHVISVTDKVEISVFFSSISFSNPDTNILPLTPLPGPGGMREAIK